MTLPKVIGPDGKINPAYIEEQAIGSTRACPDCGRPQHYTGIENGWAHDALIDTWECTDPARYVARWGVNGPAA